MLDLDTFLNKYNVKEVTYIIFVHLRFNPWSNIQQVKKVNIIIIFYYFSNKASKINQKVFELVLNWSKSVKIII